MTARPIPDWLNAGSTAGTAAIVGPTFGTWLVNREFVDSLPQGPTTGPIKSLLALARALVNSPSLLLADEPNTPITMEEHLAHLQF